MCILQEKSDLLVMVVKSFEFHLGVPDYYLFQKYWEPETNQELGCDGYFAI